MNKKAVPQKYLLAYDGSEHSVAALRVLIDLCSDSKSDQSITVHLLTIFTPRQIKDHHIFQDSLDWAAKQLQENKCFNVTTEIVLGYPSEKILEFAQQNQPEMIIMGAKGLRSTLGILLGGVAQHVVEYACCPVMIVRTPYVGLNKLLLVVDDSRYSILASEYLAKLPLADRAKIIALHVLSPLPIMPHHRSIAETWPYGLEIDLPPPGKEEDITTEEMAWQQEEEIAGNMLLSNMKERFASYNKGISEVLLRGDAATEIINYASNNNINMIISGSRGLTQIKGILLGSVSRKLVHYANCSILIVKSPELESG